MNSTPDRATRRPRKVRRKTVGIMLLARVPSKFDVWPKEADDYTFDLQTAGQIVAPPTFTGELVKLDKGPAIVSLQARAAPLRHARACGRCVLDTPMPSRAEQAQPPPVHARRVQGRLPKSRRMSGGGKGDPPTRALLPRLRARCANAARWLATSGSARAQVIIRARCVAAACAQNLSTTCAGGMQVGQ